VDWRDLLRDPEVPRIIDQVERLALRLYPLSASMARDDVASWLILQAVEVARWWAEKPECDGDPDHWQRTLHSVLAASIRRGAHIDQLHGARGSARRANMRLDSLDEPADASGTTLAQTLPDERSDPLRVVLRREALEDLLERAEHAPPTVDDGQCDECDRPVYAKGMCQYHYNKRIVLTRGTCQCGANEYARGLCRKHWREDMAHKRPPCKECDQPSQTAGLCNAHHYIARKAREAARKESQ